MLSQLAARLPEPAGLRVDLLAEKDADPALASKHVGRPGRPGEDAKVVARGGGLGLFRVGTAPLGPAKRLV